MRDYSKISADFWHSELAQSLINHPKALISALYLITSPYATMIGVYRCAPIVMSSETGMSVEEIVNALKYLIEINFCTYEWKTNLVFVHEFTKHQVGATIKIADKRHKAILKLFAKLPEGTCKQAFFARYNLSHQLLDVEESVNEGSSCFTKYPLEAPSMPGAGAGARSASVHLERSLPKRKTESRPFSISNDYKLPTHWSKWAETIDLNSHSTIELIFRKFIAFKSKKKVVQLEDQWFADWQLWILNERPLSCTADSQNKTITVPSRMERCDALLKIDADSSKAVPMPPEIRVYFAELKKNTDTRERNFRAPS